MEMKFGKDTKVVLKEQALAVIIHIESVITLPRTSHANRFTTAYIVSRLFSFKKINFPNIHF